MAERARSGATRTAPRVQTFGTAADSARRAFSWFLSRESLLRLALSFVLSVALWLYITGKLDPNLAQDFPQPLPVETINLTNGLYVTSAVPSVHVRYRADTPGVIVTSANFHPIANLAGIKAGSPTLVPVTVIPDPGLHVIRVTPARVVFTVDRTDTRSMPVQPVIVSNPGRDFAAGSIRVTPGNITVQGPHTVVSQISRASVEIHLAGATTTLDNSYAVVLHDSQGGIVNLSSRIQVVPPQVQVHVPITALSSLKTVPVLVPFAGQVKSGYDVVSLTVNPQEVIARGTPHVLGSVAEVWTTPVHLAGRKSSFTEHVRLTLGNGVTANARTAVVTVGIGKLKAK